LQAMAVVMARPNADGLKIACKQAPTAWGRGTRADVRSRGLGVGVGACLQAMVRMVERPNADNFGNLLQAGSYGVGIRAYVIWARRVWSADHLQPGPEDPALPQFTQSIKIKGR